MTTLKSGDKGKQVIQLQILLNGALKPSPRLKADGVLTVDGVVGKNTWAVR